MNNEFHRGDVWFFDPDPTRGREQKKPRPCLILSVDTYNNGPSNLLVVLPMTTKKKAISCHIEVKIAELGQTSYIMCDQIRCISKERLLISNRHLRKIASVNKKALEDIERCLKVLLGFNV
jgi:mRNA interferase MazF